MRIIFSSDDYGNLVPAIREAVQKAGHECLYIGPGPGEEKDWPDVTSEAAARVASGEFHEGIVMCWTGTGATIAANKVQGIRAALCADAETARGARIWNHANVLALSMRKTSEPLAAEILETWFATPFSEDDWNKRQIESIHRLDAR
ncbi:MAG: galactose isomerase [Spirochaetaceae bacterium]|jgi:ribose 5-phosphate isomerase B|nr:galactose isomerase [Spirochaetaceae bacterium]|tara:strand:+ start:20796 stop:21236 length:441 start_codon:yes stop_codon:yes gene_type:complete